MRSPSSAFSRRLRSIAREPVTVAIIAAGLVTAVLALAVFGSWSFAPEGQPPSPTARAIPAAAAPTPTARAISVRRATPTATSPSPSAHRPKQTNSATARPQTSIAPLPTSTPRPRPAPSRTPSVAATPTAPAVATPAPVFEAADAASLSPMATNGWVIDGDQLVFSAASAEPQPWLVVPGSPPGGDYAIELEVRVREVVQGYCNQTFGAVAGSSAGGVVWGGGIFYACGSRSPQARLTDVSDWQNGYDQDRELDSKNFDPEREWHTYRLEVRGNELRLLIDGKQVVKAQDDQVDPTATTGPSQVGVWTQGVQIAIRRIAIYKL